MAPDTLTADAPRADAKPYDAPGLTPLGEIASLTAGPDEGTLDQLAGGNGGFLPPDPSS